MQYILILAIIAAAAMVLFALGRGLYHFAQSHQATLDGTATENHLKQNQMMFARVKWQALTILLLVIVGLLASGGGK
ncbi:MAG: hypothetical protein RLZZ58_770 [Pseudomonadota bacterium]|jgi:hypothetical protein